METFIRGRVLDIGCGDDLIAPRQYPLITDVRGYDTTFGHTDAEFLEELKGETFDTIHASHLLEHLNEPVRALSRWFTQFLNPRGHIVITIPDEDAYEKGVWPSRWNADHKFSWTIFKGTARSWNHPHSMNVFDVLATLCNQHRNMRVKLVQVLDHGVDYSLKETDQTFPPDGPECAIEFVLHKLP